MRHSVPIPRPFLPTLSPTRSYVVSCYVCTFVNSMGRGRTRAIIATKTDINSNIVPVFTCTYYVWHYWIEGKDQGQGEKDVAQRTRRERRMACAEQKFNNEDAN